MSYLQKLTDLICQEKDIEKDLSEKEYYVSIVSKNNNRINNQVFIYEFWRCNSKQEAIWLSIDETRKQKENKDNQILIEVWFFKNKKIQLHHLMWYYSKKWWPFAISSEWKMMWNKQKDWSYYEIQLDNTKPLHQQSEEVLKNIFEALSS